ncbi:PstS family phosphate ABC transporter substrate-binding protein [Phycisphaeraceae bacterium D3-23]
MDCKTKFAAFGLAAAATLGLVGCGDSGVPSGLTGDLDIDGSSTVFPITEAVAEDFRGPNPDMRVTVGVSGTGGGFKRFAAGETDISDASRPIKQKEIDACAENDIEFIEIPVAYDGLSIVVNPANTWAQDLTVDELKLIFLEGSTVQNWSDVRDGWPDTPIKLFIPGTDSGTFDYFKEVVAGKEGSIRSDVTASEDDNVLVNGIAGDEGAIGFFGCAYYFENTDKLRAVTINGVGPTPETIENGSYAPFSRPLFIYVNKASAEEAHVQAFIEFYLDEGPALAQEVGYVQLPAPIQTAIRARWEARTTGTLFLDAAGEKVTGPLTDIYN